MSKQLTSTPKNDGFWMPAEWEPHDQCWMIWPERTDNWRQGGKPAQRAYATFANTIAKYEKVTMLVSYQQFEHARNLLGENVRVIECSNDDAWMRDVGPTIVKNKNGQIRGVDWIFNAWGGLLGGLYFPWDKDDAIAQKTCEILNIDYYRPDFVLEGGSIHTDGERTLFTTEECLLNKNRNPHLTKEQIEENLKSFCGVDKVIWLPFGVYNDETNGHVDNMLHVVAPGHVLLTWTEDKDDPQYERSQAAYQILTTTLDAKGREIKVTKLHQPGPLFIEPVEADDIDLSNTMARAEGLRMPASYANFYIANQAIILPIFGDKYDDLAITTLQTVFPNHKIEPIMAREILLGGGNIHCITQQQPTSSK
ncbi:agmatine deiminase [Spiroplasma eriocheiris]|uniref:Putative agmatine deiminase n=1 Tax=Spiroplasma eriocheiris TaxID=315358 RepID=A0A0H3XIK0_9MOLU|nr:agmatine deiminase [Spiroplasma eriocheiris]AHF58261.1 agmatine deiminase [Spiroplasma eriocheiris CCTCC M 207170]AKM54698.1 agmatine deiminase [Spiroplasma eriocheiris]